MASDILLVQKHGHVGTLIFNRPDKRNSLSPDLLILLHQAMEQFCKDGHTRAVIIRGTGDKAFSSGYDITAIPTSISKELQEKLKRQNPLELALKSITDFPFPVIAMLNGYALGAGCELAVSCDLRIGADDIRMGMPPAKLGIVYSVPGLMRFVRLVGFAKTKEIFFTGRYFDARRAQEMGLVDYLLPKPELEQFTFGMAEEIASNSPLSVKGTKRILSMLAGTERLSAEQMQEAEKIIAASFNSEDLKEGQIAFLEKRKPVFKGR